MRTDTRDQELERQRQLQLDAQRAQDLAREKLLSLVEELALDFFHAPEQIGYYLAELDEWGRLRPADLERAYWWLAESHGRDFAERALRGPSLDRRRQLADEVVTDLRAEVAALDADRLRASHDFRRQALGRIEELTWRAGVRFPELTDTRDPAGTSRQQRLVARALSGQARPLPYREELERVFGQGLGHVEAFADEDAQHAVAELGMEGFAVGHKVAFRAETPAREIVAHEAAHALQQPAYTGGRVSHGLPDTSLEAEADRAAAALVTGIPFQVTEHSGQPRLAAWYAHEHKQMGDVAASEVLPSTQSANGLKLGTKQTDVRQNAAPQCPDCKTLMLMVYENESGFFVKVENFLEMFGLKDFDGEKFWGYRCDQCGKRVAGQNATRQVTTITMGTQEPDRYVGHGTFVPGRRGTFTMGDANFMGGDVSETPGQMARTADAHTLGFFPEIPVVATNINHFFPLAFEEWKNHHGKAVTLAGQAAAAGDQAKLNKALLTEGFAAHFLQDSLSSGHQYPAALDIFGGLESQTSQAFKGLWRRQPYHDLICALPDGLPMKSKAKGEFVAGGDNFIKNEDYKRTIDATKLSLLEVLGAAGMVKPGHQAKESPAAHAGEPDTPNIYKDPVAGVVWRTMLKEVEGDLKKGLAEDEHDSETTAGGTKWNELAMSKKIAAAIKMKAPPAREGADTLYQDLDKWMTTLHKMGNRSWYAQCFVSDGAGGNKKAGEEKEEYFRKMFFYLQTTGMVSHTLSTLRAVSGLNPPGSTGDDFGKLLYEATEALNKADMSVGTVQPLGGHGSAPEVDSDAYEAYDAARGKLQDTKTLLPQRVADEKAGKIAKVRELPQGSKVSISNVSWNGTVLVFNVSLTDSKGKKSKAPTDTPIYVRWFDKDCGWDHDKQGKLIGAPSDWKDRDDAAPHLTMVSFEAVGLGKATAPVDNPGDTYAIFYRDVRCQDPIYRSEVQGEQEGTAKVPMQAVNFTWNGPTIFFNVVQGGKLVGGRKVWIKWFDCDAGYDRNKAGHDEDSSAWDTDTDELLGQAEVTVRKDGFAMHTVKDDPGDTYVTVYLDSAKTIPIGRSYVQGKNDKKQVILPAKASQFSWNKNTLTFRVTKNGKPAAKKTFGLAWYNCDSGLDRNKGGFLGDATDSDDYVDQVSVTTDKNGWVTVTATGDANNPGDTYGVAYMDTNCTIPIGRSGIQQDD